MKKILAVSVTRNKEHGEWACELTGPGGGVFIYLGTNGDAAHDVYDDIAPVLEQAEAVLEQAEEGASIAVDYVRLRQGADTKWVTTLKIGDTTIVLKEFGKGGANKAADFCEEVHHILKAA